MSKVEYCEISLPNHESTLLAGRSLARTLYTYPVTVLLSGELGAGKTTLLQGFAMGLGIARELTSPTFALEQRYASIHGPSLAHLDLYRLTPPQARELLLSSEDAADIRCIEWPERLELNLTEAFPEHISIALREEGQGRVARIRFADVPMPTEEAVRRWQNALLLPEHLIAHCDTVASAADQLSVHLLQRGTLVRRTLLRTAAIAHDLMRFVDFRPNAFPGEAPTPAQETLWEAQRKTYPGMRHEHACAAFLAAEGYRALGEIVAVHGLSLPSPNRSTIEQQLLFYADKRVAGDRIVSVRERFEDFRRRYGESKDRRDADRWYAEAQELEQNLFPSGPPPLTSSTE